MDGWIYIYSVQVSYCLAKFERSLGFHLLGGKTTELPISHFLFGLRCWCRQSQLCLSLGKESKLALITLQFVFPLWDLNISWATWSVPMNFILPDLQKDHGCWYCSQPLSSQATVTPGFHTTSIRWQLCYRALYPRTKLQWWMSPSCLSLHLFKMFIATIRDFSFSCRFFFG